MRRLWAVALMTLALLAGCTQPPPPVQPAESPRNPAPAEQPGSSAAYDLVIRGGTVVDGSGSNRFKADIAVSGDRIVAVGNLGRYTAGREIDASGLIVAPGFINPHSHTHDDAINPFIERDAVASLMQGITTELGGVDGRSPVGIKAELDRLAAEGTGVNFGLFLGQGSVRERVMGSAAGPASPEQLEQMKALVRKGMKEGAFGLSTGLEYRFGSFADTDELIALVAETKPSGIYATHVRSEGDRVVEAIQEALEIGRRAGVPVNLSHLKIVHHRNWGKEQQVIDLIEGAIKGGQKVFADVYPYLAPDYAINRPLADWAGALPPQYLLLAGGVDARLQGRTVADAATLLKVPPEQGAAAVLAAHPQARVVALVSSESAMLRFYKAPWAIVSTDGEAQPKLKEPAEALSLGLHRRSYGSYPMLLGHLVRERQVLTLEQAVRKSTGQVADLFGIKGRGYVKVGQHADLVLFSAETVADRTSWLAPQVYPEGVRWVLINGRVAVQNGEWVGGQRWGRIIRPGE